MKNTAFDRSKRIIIIGIIVVIVAGLFLALFLWEKNRSEYNGDVPDDLTDSFLEHNGKSYELRNHIETVLVIGVDKFSDSIDQSSYNNDQQADFLMLLVIDNEQKTCSALHLNRDTMTDVTVLGVGGTAVGTVNQQIALSHTYGSGGEDSCENTVDAVSKLLCGVKIDHYVSLTMDAVQILNDMVGGVTVTVLDDLSSMDEELKQGETVNLMGEQALIYVRNRYGLNDSSNASRMERQQQYLKALYLKTLEYVEDHDSFSTEAEIRLSNHMISDCNLTQMDSIFDDVVEYDVSNFYSLEGELTVGEKFMEFYPDENAKKELIISLFCKEDQKQ